MTEHVKMIIESKTNGRHILRLNREHYKTIFSFPGFRGLCIQSTNAKKNGHNATLYPCIYGKDPRTERRYVKQIHRVIIPYVPYGYVVDHINGDTFDNRRMNLEVVTRAENTRRAQTNRVNSRTQKN